MDTKFALAGGAGLGVALMYLLDPDRGQRRRSLVRDQATHLSRRGSHAVDVTARDAANRLRGVVATLRSRSELEVVSDEVLVERARSRVGRLVGHPGSIEVDSTDGHVTLRGPVLAAEVPGLLAGVAAVRGVRAVENHLDVYERAGHTPGLQGEPAVHGGQFELLQRHWSPTARLLVGSAGGVLALYGAYRRGRLGAAIGLAGLGLLGRGLVPGVRWPPLPMRAAVARRGIDLDEAIVVAAPVERVYAFWQDFANFPHVFTPVREVRTGDAGRSHWVVAGPAGAPIECDVVVTDAEPSRTLAWATVPGSVVEHTGRVDFEARPDGHTGVTVRLTYRPAVGQPDEVVRMLFAGNPAAELDADLVRLRALVEAEAPAAPATGAAAPPEELFGVHVERVRAIGSEAAGWAEPEPPR